MNRNFVKFPSRLCIALIVISSVVLYAQENPERANNKADITITVLGSGTPIPSGSQFGTAILVQVGGKHLMFDCGRGCTTRLAQLDPQLIPKVNHLFITHLHSDHLMGIDDLWLNGWTQGRKVPLKIWGPVGTNDMMQGLRQAFARDIVYRRADGVPAPSAALDDAFTDLSAKGGLVFDEDGIQVTAFSVDHSTIKPAYGYKISYNGRILVISGDTTSTASLYEQGRDSDVLMLEVMSPSIVKYLRTIFDEKQLTTVLGYHMTAEQAADVFKKSNPRLGVYYHTSNESKAGESILEVTRSLYDGRIEISHDLYQISLGEEIIVRDVRQNP